MANAPLLEIRSLSTYFYTDEGVVKAVENVSFDIYPGEVLGIVGESGCGKSVTSLSILKLIPDPPGKIVHGEILLKEKIWSGSKKKRWRRSEGTRFR